MSKPKKRNGCTFFFSCLFFRALRDGKRGAGFHKTYFQGPILWLDSWLLPKLPLDGTTKTRAALASICSCVASSGVGSISHYNSDEEEYAHFCGQDCITTWKRYLEGVRHLHVLDDAKRAKHLPATLTLNPKRAQTKKKKRKH